MSRKTIIILALVLVPVALMIGGAALGVGGKAFPNAHFVIAFGLGATFSVLLAVGLFALSFHSSRSGHDDKVMDERTGDETDSDGA
jgi:membrane protein implicated in regulation of membrane protease activity